MDIRTMPASDFLYLLISAIVACGTAVIIAAGIFIVLEFCLMYLAKRREMASRLDYDKYFKDRKLGAWND